MGERDWLRVLTRLRIDRAKGPAPHKPLLLLLLLEMADSGEIAGEDLRLTPELAFRFSTYWSIVAHRRSQPPDVRLPFHHLNSDGIWMPFTRDGQPSVNRKFTSTVRFDPDFVSFLRDRTLRTRARRILIATYFEPAERIALYQLAGMRIPSEDDIARDTAYAASAREQGRETRFRLDIVMAYNYTCALTGYRVSTIEGAAIVDAAHIHPFSRSNNNPRNGLALCKNAHWLFDHGLWSLDDEYRVIVAEEAFAESSPNQKSLVEYQGHRIQLPSERAIWPDPMHLAWHRKHKLQVL